MLQPCFAIFFFNRDLLKKLFRFRLANLPAHRCFSCRKGEPYRFMRDSPEQIFHFFLLFRFIPASHSTRIASATNSETVSGASIASTITNRPGSALA